MSNGHTVGDRVLRSIAASVRSQLREGDILIRLGGDEFMVVLLVHPVQMPLRLGKPFGARSARSTSSMGTADPSDTEHWRGIIP